MKQKSFPERLAWGTVQRRNHPGQSTCMRCQLPWALCDSHSVKMSERKSCFAICEDCWQELAPEERLIYYEALFHEWAMMSSEAWDDWQAVKDNILKDV